MISVLSKLRIINCPRHIAFIMDGNRRFAHSHNLDKNKGHMEGFNTLISILDYCLQSNIKIVTIYAFSLDNFNRSPEEVDFLLSLAVEKFKCFQDQKGFVNEKDIRIRIIGDVTRFPEEVQHVASEIEDSTRSNNSLFLNICFGYSSTWEIQKAMNQTQDSLEDFPLYLEISNPDLLVRTSGENRLSDFLLYQCSQGTQIMFVTKCWPELKFTDFLKMLFKFKNKNIF
eukprot:NODE_40_length_29852_cov_0.370215.p12 type:complete len:228 gc:universal NODE_40_length_29852_cov_0.370215:24998-24315(-)